MIHLTQDEYRSLIMGEYRLTPCVCEMGLFTLMGISERRYHYKHTASYRKIQSMTYVCMS